jgi:hypothetical protein
MKIRTRALVALVGILFLAPTAAAAQNGAPEPIEVALRMANGYLIVPVTAADGTEFEFTLSTGTPPTVLAQSTAEHLAGSTDLRMGGVPLNMDGVQTISDDRLTRDGELSHGMVGAQTLASYDILVDVPGGRLLLRPIGRPAPWPGVELGEATPLRIFHGVILSMQVELNGLEFPASLDLGITDTLINAPAADRLGITDEASGTVALGGATMKSGVRVSDLDIFGRWDPNGTGFVIVGAPITADCAVAISWVRSELRTCVR